MTKVVFYLHFIYFLSQILPQKKKNLMKKLFKMVMCLKVFLFSFYFLIMLIVSLLWSTGVRIFVDMKAQLSLLGTEMDYVESELSSEFVFNNPNIKGTCGCGESFSV